ncbi:MAG: hypothetical protein ACK4M3_02495 [Pyrobaculum sp.]
MDLLQFVEAFHVEGAKLLDVVESAGEAGGVMEWVVGRVGSYEVYFLWFPATRRLIYVIKSGEMRREGVVEARGRLDAIAQVEKIVRTLR